MSRLYLRIYLAVFGSLIVFALLVGMAAIAGWLFEDEHYRPFPDRGAEIADRLLAADRSPAELEEELEFWGERTGLALVLIAPDGRMLAKVGDIPRRFNADHIHDRRHPFWRRPDIHRYTLNDGRKLIAIPPDPGRRPLRYGGWLAALIGIALAVGIAAYPVVRQLTRRLERLEQGVAEFGAGDLSTRVDIPGRDEIARLGKTFNASADRIETLLTAHKTLLANASHELRSPLSRLRMALESLSDREVGAARTEIARNIEELDALVGEILLASRLQANQSETLVFEPVDLAGLLAEECANYDAELSVTHAANIIVNGDTRLLRRIFRNLLENAKRYAGGEPVDVTVGIDGEFAWTTVCDRGPGIPEDEREKIFEPFYRMKSASESSGGTGLGLALVQQITERHGGQVSCFPREGGGSCFRIRLPAYGV